MDDLAVVLEHVDFLDTTEGLDAELLKGRLELAVVATSRLGDLLDLTAGGTCPHMVSFIPIFFFRRSLTLATDTDLRLELGKLVSVHCVLNMTS